MNMNSMAAARMGIFPARKVWYVAGLLARAVLLRNARRRHKMEIYMLSHMVVEAATCAACVTRQLLTTGKYFLQCLQ